MKKVFAFSAAFLLVVSFGYAQEIRIAPVVGPVASFSFKSSEVRDNLKGEEETFENDNPGLDWTYRNLPSPRFVLGGLLDYSLNETVSFQSGLLFHVRGENHTVKIKGTDGYGDRVNAKMKYGYNMSYLEIPLWVRYSIGDNGLKLIGGPGFGFAIGGKQKVKITGYGQDISESDKASVGKDPFEDDILPFDFSLNIGVGKEFLIGNNPLEVTLFVQPSLSKWNTSSKVSPDYSYRHFSAGLRAAYYLPIR